MRRHAHLTLAALVILGACKDSLVPDYNNPQLGDQITSSAQLQAQTRGLLAGDREQHAFQILILETMGRDAYRIDVADNRYIAQPLGGFSPGAFIVDFLWNVHYRTIHGAQVLAHAIDNSAGFSAEDKAATKGFARTIQALQYLRLIEMRDTLGLPINLASGHLDPVRCKPAVLEYISALLDSAKTDLGGAGSAFPFTLPAGFAGFDTPATFLTFNRALAAKAMLYRAFASFAKNGTADATLLNETLTLLDQSFENHADPATLRAGVFHSFSAVSGDLTNTNFNNAVYRANPKVTADTEPGDRRNLKIHRDPAALRTNGDGTASSDLLFTIVNSPSAPLPIVLNEELILMRAEALWGLNRDAEALTLVNFIRVNSGGVGQRSLGSFATHLDLLKEILRQKRLSLLWESGDRLVDFRLFGLTPLLGNEAVNPGKEPTVIPFPQAEIDARGGALTCS